MVLSRNIRLGWAAITEQNTAPQLLDYAMEAEKQGFEFAMVSDHFHPWFHKGGHAPFAWTLIASMGERTKKLRIGTGVTTPILRYHPALVAQAFASLGTMYPERIILGLGTGEAMNEVPLGGYWPDFAERAGRVEEGLQIIRSLWGSSDPVSFKGKYFSVRDAFLYEKPKQQIPIYVAASGPRMAEIAGKYADGLFTTPAPEDAMREKVLTPFAKAASAAMREPDSLNRMMLCNISWDEDYDRALQSILRWRSVGIPGGFGKAVWNPRELDELAEKVPLSDITWRWTVCTNIEDVIKRIESYVKLGFNDINMRSSSPDERRYIQEFGKKVMPYLQEEYGIR